MKSKVIYDVFYACVLGHSNLGGVIPKKRHTHSSQTACQHIFNLLPCTKAFTGATLFLDEAFCVLNYVFKIPLHYRNQL